MSQNVGLRVTGSDFSQDLATLTTHIAALRLSGNPCDCVALLYLFKIESKSDISARRADLEQLKGKEGEEKQPLKSALKRGSRYAPYQSELCLASSSELNQLELPSVGGRRQRNLSWGSGLSKGSSSSTGGLFVCLFVVLLVLAPQAQNISQLCQAVMMKGRRETGTGASH